MELKEKHKNYLKEQNLNSITDVAWHIETIKTNGGNRQMMMDLVWILVNEKDCLESFFADEILKRSVDEKENVDTVMAEALSHLNKQNRINATRLKAEKPFEFSYTIKNQENIPFYLDEVIYPFSWRPSQKTESVLTDKTVHYNPFNDGNYCPRAERVKDVEKEQKAREKAVLEQLEITPEDIKIAQKEWVDNVEKQHYLQTDWIDFIGSNMKRGRVISYESPLAPKQKDKVTTEDLKVFKNPEVKDCTIKDGKVEYGVKESEGKSDYSEINFEILDLMAKRFAENKHKYPKGNSKKPLDKQEILWAAFRHIRKMLQPIENDPETYEEHLSAIATNMSILLDQLRLNKS